MEVRKENLEVRETYRGRESRQGWLVLNLRGLDLEGVQELSVNLDLLAEVSEKRKKSASLFEQLASKLPPSEEEC